MGGWAWTFSILAVGSATTPAVISATSGDQLSDAEKGFTIALPVAAALFGSAAIAAFNRQEHATMVAKEAGLGALDPTAPATICTKAVADWNGSRSDASSAMRERIKQEAARAGAQAPAGDQETRKLQPAAKNTQAPAGDQETRKPQPAAKNTQAPAGSEDTQAPAAGEGTHAPARRKR